MDFYWNSLDKAQAHNYSFFLMSLVGRSLISLNNWSLNEVNDLFSRSSKYKLTPQAISSKADGKLVSLAFFEPSTRTKLSFQMALGRLGLFSSDLGALSDSSMVKGESFSETLKTIEAMSPELIIMRANATDGELNAINEYSLPLINAGCGAIGHPTQALTDAFTISEKLELKNLVGQKAFYQPRTSIKMPLYLAH